MADILNTASPSGCRSPQQGSQAMCHLLHTACHVSIHTNWCIPENGGGVPWQSTCASHNLGRRYHTVTKGFTPQCPSHSPLCLLGLLQPLDPQPLQSSVAVLPRLSRDSQPHVLSSNSTPARTSSWLLVNHFIGFLHFHLWQ